MADVYVAGSGIRGPGVFAARGFAAGATVLALDDPRAVDAGAPSRGRGTRRSSTSGLSQSTAKRSGRCVDPRKGAGVPPAMARTVKAAVGSFVLLPACAAAARRVPRVRLKE